MPTVFDDEPIQSKRDDCLGRGSLAESIATAIRSWSGSNSFVIAVYGPWGSGKSSFKNLALEQLNVPEAPLVVTFNPWAWSGRDSLLAAFFREVEIAVAGQSKAAITKEWASCWRRYSSYLSLAEKVACYVSAAAAYLGDPATAIAMKGVSDTVRGATVVAKGAADAHAAAQEETLDQLKESLSGMMRQLRSPIVVVMDDIDHVSDDEIRMLLQLIKVNADLPKMVYLLLCDRANAERALGNGDPVLGRTHLEKTVHVSFELPPVDSSAVDRLLRTGLENLLDLDRDSRTFEIDRWENLYPQGVRPFFTTLRDVTRFLYSCSFIFRTYCGGNRELHVNFIDLIALELIRTFEPSVYANLPRAKSVLIGRPIHGFDGRDITDSANQQFEALVQFASEHRQVAVKTLLEDLFPNPLRDLTHGMTNTPLPLRREKRICVEQVFDGYFRLSTGGEDVRQRTVRELLVCASNAGDAKACMRSLFEREDFVDLVKAVKWAISSLSMRAAGNLLAACFEIDPYSTFTPKREERCRALEQLMYDVVASGRNTRERGRVLLWAMHNSKGVYCPVKLMSKSFVPPAAGLLGSDQAVEEVRFLCLARIGEWLKSKLGYGLLVHYYVDRMREFGGKEAVKRYVKERLTSAEDAVQLLWAFASHARGKWRISLKNMSKYVDIRELERLLKPMMGTAGTSAIQPSNLHSVVLVAFQHALKLGERVA